MEKLNEKNDQIKHREKKRIKQFEITREDEPREKQFSILGFTIWRIIIYFIIYSILGYVIETIFGLITKGVLESRKNFLYGPFCCIYGIGALVVILGLQKFKKNISHHEHYFINNCFLFFI